MHTIINNIDSITAFAPATCANVAVGFDVLGFAMEGIGDYVTLTRRKDKKIVIESIDAQEQLPHNVNKNTASVVIKKLCEDLQLNIGFSMQIRKGIALGSGMGGSAASAVAALVACNAFIHPALSVHELARYALLGEAVACGQAHADNVVPCLFGGLTLTRSVEPLEVIQLPIPDVFSVLVHPHLRVETKQARKILKKTVPLKMYVKQSANLAAFIAALYQSNDQLLANAMEDVLIEPQRAVLIPHFYQIKQAALEAGALAVSLSGSGPSMFAWVKTKALAENVGKQMQDCFAENGIAADYWISKISSVGAVKM
ncbi:MAG TPA: homoserine kinase [Gammaproteobacteria bacterium]|jgi:homoserine kinase|nr:homoserine kinase [Gammaproteobacteria bacterium]